MSGISEPDFVRLADPADLFKRRAARFAALAADHPLGPYLGFLAGIAAAQDRVQSGADPLPVPDAERLEQRLEHKMPLIAKDDVLGPAFDAILDGVIGQARVADAPEPAEQARRRLHAMDPAERAALAGSVFDGVYLPEQLAETVYVAAALQVHLVRLASLLDATAIRPVADGVCPGCGSPPVASLMVDWAGAGRARYCCCALCGTLWNYLRVKCTACSSEGGIEYFMIAESSPEIAVETCSVCRSYIKHLHQDRRPELEPLVDDIASFALDLKMREQSFQRTCANPFLVAA